MGVRVAATVALLAAFVATAFAGERVGPELKSAAQLAAMAHPVPGDPERAVDQVEREQGRQPGDEQPGPSPSVQLAGSEGPERPIHSGASGFA